MTPRFERRQQIRCSVLGLIAPIIAGLGCRDGGSAGSVTPVGMPTVLDFHLTARPWSPLNLPRERYLRNVESVARAMVQYQDTTGAIIDPVKDYEVQYATPYFAYGVAALIDAGRAPDLLDAARLAMDHSTGQVALGIAAIPDGHGEFFVAPLTEAYDILRSHVSPAAADAWHTNLGALPIDAIIQGLDNNWRTYAMKGEWRRGQLGFDDLTTAVSWLEQSWLDDDQLARVSPPDLQLYHDTQVDPETYAYDGVARMNLEAVVGDGYAGASQATMQTFTVTGGETEMKLLAPSGQGAANGRSGDHSWNDVVPGNLAERLANRYKAAGDDERAGRYRRAAMLILQGTDRWLRPDGSYSTTKNQFDFASQVHYADYSARTQYNGTMMYHQAESYRLHDADIPEWPTWTEVGGYAFQTDDAFAGAFANAGGLQVQIALRGQTAPAFSQYWTALGVSRWSRVGWDDRLGPSDGIRDQETAVGLTFAPTFLQDGQWVRLASMPDVYRADFTALFVHPLLVRFALDYHPLPGATGPTFHQDFVLTPDGALVTSTSSAPDGQWGTTWPLLADDGAGRLTMNVAGGVASTRFAAGTDQQSFIALGDASQLTMDGAPVLSGYGYLQSVRYVEAGQSLQKTFVYPHNDGAPDAGSVQQSFTTTPTGWTSVLGRVDGNSYVGSTSAGGEAQALDIDGDGVPDVQFDQLCKFVVQLHNGRVTALEADRAVNATLATSPTPIALAPFLPVRF
jgi:hypothetical protein